VGPAILCGVYVVTTGRAVRFFSTFCETSHVGTTSCSGMNEAVTYPIEGGRIHRALAATPTSSETIHGQRGLAQHRRLRRTRLDMGTGHSCGRTARPDRGTAAQPPRPCGSGAPSKSGHFRRADIADIARAGVIGWAGTTRRSRPTWPGPGTIGVRVSLYGGDVGPPLSGAE